MTRADIIERMALDAYNRMRVRRGMKPVDYIGANHTPEANACREDMAAALSVLDDLIDREALDALIEGKAVVVPRELLEFYGDQERWTAYSSDERAGASNRSFGSEFGLDEGQRARNALALPCPMRRRERRNDPE